MQSYGKLHGCCSCDHHFTPLYRITSLIFVIYTFQLCAARLFQCFTTSSNQKTGSELLSQATEQTTSQ